MIRMPSNPSDILSQYSQNARSCLATLSCLDSSLYFGKKFQAMADFTRLQADLSLVKLGWMPALISDFPNFEQNFK